MSIEYRKKIVDNIMRTTRVSLTIFDIIHTIFNEMFYKIRISNKTKSQM